MQTKYDILKIAALALACSAISPCAFAQTQNEPAKKEASQKPEPGEVPGNQPRIDWTENESLALQGLVDKHMPDTGFTPTISWAGEQYSNVSGGIATGTKWDSLFTLGFEQDFSKLAQKEGLGSFGITAFYYTASGDFDGDNLGALSSPSNIFSGEMMRVFEIFYTNSVETEYGTFGFRAGQLAADEDFMGLDYADIFLNSNFGAIPAIAGNTLANGANAFSQYALATLGGTIFWQNEKFEP